MASPRQPVVRYIHHGVDVAVYAANKGKHRQNCLCYSCTQFQPDDPARNCPIAQKLYEYDQAHHVVTPVWECPQYSPLPEWEWEEAEMCSCKNPCENCIGVDIAAPGFDQTVEIHYNFPEITIKHISPPIWDLPRKGYLP